MKPRLLPYRKKATIAICLSILSLSTIAQTKTRVTGAANWNANSTWVKPLNGVLTTVFLSTLVVGLGTSFSSDLNVGDVICTSDGSVIGTVSSISNDGLMFLSSNAAVIINLGGYGVERVPTAADDVEIGNVALGGAVSVALNVSNATVNSLTFIADGQSNSLTHNSTNTLTVTNAVSLNQPTSNAKTIAWNINAGTATVGGNLNFSGFNTTASRVAKIVITTGMLNANADIIFSGSTAATKVIDMSGGAGSVNLKGALTVPSSSSTLTAGTSGSIFNYNGSAAQTINYFPSGKYNNLHINNTNASGATLSAAISTSNVDGNLSVGNINSGSLFNSGNYAIVLNNSKTLTIAAGSTMNAGTSIASFGTGSPNLTINGTFKTANTNGFSGSATTAINAANPPTYAIGAASTIEYNAAGNQVVSGRSDYATIIVSGGGIKTANADITANINMHIGTSTILNGSGYTHYIRGTLTSTGSFAASASTMVFSGTGAQTIPALTYNNLETSTGGIKTASGAITVAGNLTIGNSTTFAASSYTHSLSGNLVNNGSFTEGTSTINFNGASSQYISGATDFYHVTLNNPNELVINSSITVDGALTLTNGRFNINGKTLRLNGSFAGSASHPLKGSAVSNLSIGYGFSSGTLYFDQTAATFNNYIKTFTVHSNTTIGNNLNIIAGSSPGSIDLSSGSTLTTNDLVTLKSDANGTARISELPVNGAGAATGYISGKITVERYIPAARGWRLLSVPVKTTNAPTINQAWQEGLTTASVNPNLYPGYGIKICGGSSANGYDTSATTNTFIKTYNNATNSFVALPSSPGTNIPITSYPAYFLYIRGDRSVDMLQGLAATITSTTLRTKGEMVTGKQDVNVSAANFSVLGNPYASAINFHTLTRTNVADAFYAWDPKLAGNYGIGGYVTFIWNNSTGSYDATASVGNITQYIQSSASVIVYSADHTNPGTINIKESDKTALGEDPIFRLAQTDQRMSIKLNLVNADSSTSLLDAVLTTYDDNNLNTVDNDDASKLYGSNQSINILRDGKRLAIERRKTISTADTTFLNIYQMKIQNYQLEINLQHMDANGMIAVLKDNYSTATNNTILQMNGTSLVPFSINADPASYSADRFKIIFEPLSPLPVSFTSVKAYRQQKNIIVEWKIENQLKDDHYEIERSADGKHFTRVNAETILENDQSIYQFTDSNPLKGINYYRVIAVNSNGNKNNSEIVKANMNDEENSPSISIYPNPVSGDNINIEVKHIDEGLYNLKIYNTEGQLVATKKIIYTGAKVSINEKLPAGKYELKLSGNKISTSTQLIKK